MVQRNHVIAIIAAVLTVVLVALLYLALYYHSRLRKRLLASRNPYRRGDIGRGRINPNYQFQGLQRGNQFPLQRGINSPFVNPPQQGIIQKAPFAGYPQLPRDKAQPIRAQQILNTPPGPGNVGPQYGGQQAGAPLQVKPKKGP